MNTNTPQEIAQNTGTEQAQNTGTEQVAEAPLDLWQHLSPHFILYEFVRSGTAIENDLDNTPKEKQIEAMRALCVNILERLRTHFGPIVISSGFRRRSVNNRIPGASQTSQHLKGEAADIVVGNKERAERMFYYIKQNLDFDQLIMEPIGSPTPRWLHVSYTTKRQNRRQVVTG